VELPRGDGGILEQVIGTLGQAPHAQAPYGISIPLTDELRRVARASAPLWLHDASRGLLRTELSDSEEGLEDFASE
jgi:hypothetical protein